jgi:hypothetical protein
VFVSSAPDGSAAERDAARAVIEQLRLAMAAVRHGPGARQGAVRFKGRFPTFSAENIIWPGQAVRKRHGSSRMSRRPSGKLLQAIGEMQW